MLPRVPLLFFLSTTAVAAFTIYSLYLKKKSKTCRKSTTIQSVLSSDKAGETLDKKNNENCQCNKAVANKSEGCESKKMTVPLRIVYATQTGTSKSFAEMLQKEIFALNITGFHFDMSFVNMKDYDQDNLEHESLIIFILSTWTGGIPPEDGNLFCRWIEDMALDFRVSKTWLSKLQYAVFGLGNAEYDQDYCAAARLLNTHLEVLGAVPLSTIGLGDDNIDQEKQFRDWMQLLLPSLCEAYGERLHVETNSKQCCSVSPLSLLKQNNQSWEQQENEKRPTVQDYKKHRLSRKEFRRQKKTIIELEKNQVDPTRNNLTEEDLINNQMLEINYDSDDSIFEGFSKEKNEKDGDLVDVEDIGAIMKSEQESSNEREMVTPTQRKTLTKEGYKIIGTHSAVKLCRWTKHQLRGRGGCYKHTFYGITSYQCMETTPSLACANKCVFCWRHHKNPVGREWRWKVDDPLEIVEESITRHQNMIKELKGLPGLLPNRWQEAFTVKHCALSLVGEPIMYPHINTFVRELHRRQISSFLVTNAQFPDKIAELEPVTQLYVSIDAGTKESLKEVDRPLFKDFWERFLSCLRQLKEKGQRTVYRLTLVKSWNMQEIEEYCSLIRMGEPDLIEIKAVTYCGKSDGSNLTMENVPWHEEVREFAQAICNRMEEMYGVASEHSHSNCMLLAKKKFFINEKWHTWIDYDKFHALVERYYNDGTPFSTDDYMAETPSWAVFGAKEEGFDPVEVRFRRTREGKIVERSYKASESGCG